MQGRCHDGRLSIIAALEPPLQYNDEGSLPQPDLMEQTSETFLQRLLLVVQNVDCLHVPRDMWGLYLMYQGFSTHLLYVSSTTMPLVRPDWASKTTAVNSLMWLTCCCPASMPTIHGRCKYAVVSCQLVPSCMIAYRT
jgi:hypothetical protein